MVGKVTIGKGFGGLANYLSEDRGRVAWSETRNLVLEDPKGIAREMRAAANRSARVEKPVYHLSISFDAGDRPTRAQMQQAADRVLKDLGLERHQAYLVAHKDKEHPHVHVMVNRVHPETGKAWNAHQDYPRIERSLRTLEKEWSMRRVPGHHGRERGEPHPDRSASRATGEVRRERRTGERPLADHIREHIGKELKEARSWGELVRKLKEHGCRIEAREAGMVLTDGRRYAKASGIGRELSRQELERRFGERLSDHLAKDRSSVSGRERAPSSGAGGLRANQPGPGLVKPGAGRDAVSRRGGGVPGGAGGVLRAMGGRDEPEEVRAVKALTARGLHAAERLMARRRQSRSEESDRSQDESGRSQGVNERAGRERTPLPGGMAWRRHRREAVRDPELVAVMRNLRAYERTRGKEMELAHVVRTNGELSSRLKEVPRLEARVREQSRAFDEALAKVYQNPGAAREAFERGAKEEGARAAFEAMRRDPERFGAVHQQEHRRWIGLRVEVDKSEAYRAAQGAAHRGRDYLTAKGRMPDATELARLRGVVDHAEQRMSELKRQLAGLPRADALYTRLGERAARLSENQVRRLERALPSPRMGVVREAAARVVELAKGHGR